MTKAVMERAGVWMEEIEGVVVTHTMTRNGYGWKFQCGNGELIGNYPTLRQCRRAAFSHVVRLVAMG